jgi:hypothetical protein
VAEARAVSRNLGSTWCHFCTGAVALDELPRLIKREEAGAYYATGSDGYGYIGGLFANATCAICGAKYLAWVDLSGCPGYGRSGFSRWGAGGLLFFDLSHRRAFNDEPDEQDLPDWKIEQVALSADQCSQLDALAGTIMRRRPWPRCEATGRKVYSVYGCPCPEHRGHY